MTDSMLEYYSTPALQAVNWRTAMQVATALPHGRLFRHLKSIPPLTIKIYSLNVKRDYMDSSRNLVGTYARDPIGRYPRPVMYTWKSFHVKSPDFTETRGTRFTLAELRAKLFEALPKDNYKIYVNGGTWPRQPGVHSELEQIKNGFMVMNSYKVYSQKNGQQLENE